MPNTNQKKGKGEDIAYGILFVMAIVVIVYMLHYLISSVIILNSIYINLIFVAIVILFSYIVIKYIEKYILLPALSSIEKRRAAPLRYLFNFVTYFILLLLLLSMLKIDLTGLIFGSAFIALVLGLAGQTVLGNLFAGIEVLLIKPVVIGERVTISTWQYGVIAPAYPPKFYSNDFLVPGYTGVIEDITLMYLVIKTDDNRLIKIPHGIFIQAMILHHSKTDHTIVRAKYEVEKSLDPDKVINAVRDAVSKCSFIYKSRPPVVLISETTLNSYILLVSADVRSTHEEPPRSEMLKTIIATINKLKSEMNRA